MATSTYVDSVTVAGVNVFSLEVKRKLPPLEADLSSRLQTVIVWGVVVVKRSRGLSQPYL
jgi:hypothetical protein